MLLFGCLALGSLVVDLGLVVLTQVQMQAVADPAALEGLRLRDALDVNGQPVGDSGRRQAAARMASLVFDDDVDPLAAPTQPLQLGVGPELTLTDHADPNIAALHASRLITVPPQRAYLPALQPNLANRAHGDLVAGTFTPPGAMISAIENSAYVRNDFIPSDAAGSATAPAFLVRLRRTNDFDGLDSEAGTSSSGTAIPLLLGHGSLTPFSNPDNPNNYNFREHGFTVRATALADARPALRVGLPQASAAPPLEGATPFALDQRFWASLSVHVSATVAVDVTTGTISNGGLVAGRFTPPPPIPPAPPNSNIVTAVGQLVVPAAPVLPTPVTGYAPLYQVVTENGVPVERVVGFGHVTVTGSLPSIQVTKLPASVAPGNASRHLIRAPLLPDATVWPILLAANNALALDSGVVLTPTLVR